MSDQRAKPSRHHIWQISRRTLAKAWDDSIFSESAEAGFWTCLSTPPLMLGLLGTLAYVAPLFGPDTLASIIKSTLSMTRNFFSPNVVDQIIEPTIRDITGTARGEVASLGFLISLWAGSSAISSFVDAVV
jgi:membrane protein